MVNKTTRIRTTQAPTVATYDLTNQLDGVTQTFTLPVAINSQVNHYLIYSNRVYRNSAARIYYTISSDGRTLTTQLGDPIINAPGVNLQLVASDYAESSGEPITETTLLGHLDSTLANAKKYTDDKVSEVKDKVDELKSFDIKIVRELPTTNISEHTIYLMPTGGVVENNKYDEFLYVNGAWEIIGFEEPINFGNYYNKQEVDAAIAAAGGHAADAYTKAEVDGFLNNKVSKEAGKGLSTNDYTTAEKDKLAGVEAQANKTVVDAELSNFSINPVQNKVIKAELDSIIGGKADKNSVYTQIETDNLLDLRVMKENGMGLSTNDFTTELKDKLTAIEDAAQVNKIEEIKTADGVALTITDKSVTLPAATAAVDAYTKAQSDDKYVAKETGKTLTSNDFTGELKTKLEGVANNANKNVQADWNEADTDSDAFIKNKPVIPAGSVLYDATGAHTDGSMTQKIITEELNKKVDKVDGKGLSTNDFTNEFKDKLNAVNENGEANVLNGVKTADGNELTIADKKVTLPNFALKSDISSVYKVKGSKANKTELDDIVDKEVGDVYNLTDTGVNYVWTGTEWDSLSGNVDLTGYYTKAQADGKFVAKETGKGLSTNDLTNELKAKIENTKSGGIYLTTARLAQTIGQSKVIAIGNVSGLSADKVVVNETIIYDDSNGIGVVEAIAGNALKVKTISLGLIVNTKNEIQLAYAQDFYSQHEQTIGYYMGKPLYQITLSKLFSSKPTDKQEIGTIPGLEKIVEVDGVVLNSTTRVSYSTSYGEMPGSKFISVVGAGENGQITLNVGAGMPSGSYVVEITVKYTKKTDTATAGDRIFINQALISRPDLWDVGKTYALGDGLMGARFKGTVPTGGKVTLPVPTSFGTSVAYGPNVRTIYNSFVTVKTKKGEVFETHPAGYYGKDNFITPLYCPQYDGYNLAFETSPNYVGHDFNAWALFSAKGAA